RAAEIAAHGRREPLDVALGHRAVKAHPVDEGLALLGAHVESHDRRRPAGREVHEEEGEGAREHDHERPQRDALREEADYCLSEAEVTSWPTTIRRCTGPHHAGPARARPGASCSGRRSPAGTRGRGTAASRTCRPAAACTRPCAADRKSTRL